MDLALSGGIVLATVVFSIAVTVAWVLTLVNAAQTEQWVWFIMMLLFGPIVSLLYFMMAYKSADTLAADLRRRDRRRRRRARVAVEVHSAR